MCRLNTKELRQESFPSKNFREQLSMVEAYLEPFQTCMKTHFCKNNQWFLALNY